MKFKLLLINIAFTMLSVPVIQAQVTIGLEAKPREGLLLDLKENEETGKEANSEKGFGLPRVNLSDLNELTIDNNSVGNNYIGTIVYNVNTILGEGTYCWYGSTWKRIVLVDNPGADGNILISNNDNTYSWSDFVIPDYKFHKPTQTVAFDQSKAEPKTYSFNQIVPTRMTDSVSYPDSTIFENDFVYTETLTPQSENTEKYILLEIAANITKTTVGNASVKSNFWEETKIEILLDNNTIKTFRRNYSTPINTKATNTIDVFSIISLNALNLEAGSHSIRVRISNTANTYYANYGTASGQFTISDLFLTIEINNFGLILYEDD